jgi:hypothetical protein
MLVITQGQKDHVFAKEYKSLEKMFHEGKIQEKEFTHKAKNLLEKSTKRISIK